MSMMRDPPRVFIVRETGHLVPRADDANGNGIIEKIAKLILSVRSIVVRTRSYSSMYIHIQIEYNIIKQLKE